MNIVELESFLAVVEYHSVSLAAKRMHTTQPTLSKRIKKLEQELGAQLFYPSNQGVVLTEKGKNLIPYIRQIHNIYQDMVKAELSNSNCRPHLKIKLGSSPYVSHLVAPEFITYMNDHKTNYFIVNSSIATKELVTSLNSGNVDIIIAPALGNHPHNFSCLPLWKEKMIPVSSIHHPLAKLNKAISISELAQHEAVLLMEDSPIRSKFDLLLSEQDISIKLIAEVNSIHSNIHLIEMGTGWCIINERMLNEKLSTIELNDLSMDLEFNAYFLKKRADERLIWAFVEYLQQWLSESPQFSKLLLHSKSLAMQDIKSPL
ncbi:Cyn operon transcriptional activator [Legionella massiliensis]|uniref:Cyn operon transcriptional activator n=1 Tax=Legionella massiliensis TaxID=1034943 RepID=A0A078KZU9_9GAMM|nr:LysR family transcriptional regulator [Legionella massiliensis]CDZ78527.1 Cyn operon transcriptional activator [Legionella massiliensis]CEE14265.1 HTH-type transcriptional regulator CynR [Legionella massiliensis]